MWQKACLKGTLANNLRAVPPLETQLVIDAVQLDVVGATAAVSHEACIPRFKGLRTQLHAEKQVGAVCCPEKPCDPPQHSGPIPAPCALAAATTRSMP